MARVTTRPPLIPVFDLKLDASDLDAVAETLRSGWLTMGPRTAEFEEAFAELLGVRHAVAVSSCTAALHLAYLAAGLGPGDEIIMPSFTFVATAAAAVYAGATPVFADIIGLDNPSIDPADVERKLTSRTKAVAVVHFGGYPAAVDELRDLCQQRGLALIEDCAHTPSVSLDGKKLGSFGLAGAFSFFSNKVFAIGEGGLVATDDDAVASFARSRRSHAMSAGTWQRHTRHSDAYDVLGLGFNYRIDEPRSALALSRLGRLEDNMARRRELTFRYRAALGDLEGLVLPFRDGDVACSSGYVMAVFVLEPERRGSFRKGLLEHYGIQTSVFYPPVHEFTAYRRLLPPASLPRTELAGRTEVTLPLFTHMTTEQQDRVIEAVRLELEA
jgi:dTDP-4-amino-4,6-dideoxygalactose transaminase